MTGSADRLHRLIFLLTAGLLFAAAVLRSVLDFAGDAYLAEVLLLLLGWLVLLTAAEFVTARRAARATAESPASRRDGASGPRTATGRGRAASWGPLFPLYMAAQTAIVVMLLARAPSGDFYAVLFGVLSMQAMQRLGWKTALIWIALFTPLTALPLTLTYDVPQAIAFAFMYLVVNAFLAFFTFVTGRAAEARAENEVLADELHVANREIQAYSQRIERLAATKERHRLARELHDSVTQTVFSMNLTAQSAALLLERDRSAATAQLERLEELTQGALAEIRTLGSELAQGSEYAPAVLAEGGLAPALRRHLAERGLLAERDMPAVGGPVIELRLVDERGPVSERRPVSERGPVGERGPVDELRLRGESGRTGQSGLPDRLSVMLIVEGETEPANKGAVSAAPPEAATAGRKTEEPNALSAAEEIGLFRIAQEALNNIVKHARADEAAIRLRLSPPPRLEIEDHGRGFSLEGGTSTPVRESTQAEGSAGGMGLASMRERAAEIGWSLRITSAPGAGTRVVVEQGAAVRTPGADQHEITVTRQGAAATAVRPDGSAPAGPVEAKQAEGRLGE